jgi:hypothetical protein
VSKIFFFIQKSLAKYIKKLFVAELFNKDVIFNVLILIIITVKCNSHFYSAYFQAFRGSTPCPPAPPSELCTGAGV